MRNKLQLMLDGGAVQRYHTLRTVQRQTVAEHSFGVAWLVYLLTSGAPSVALLLAAMGHDLAECETGDLPAPAKRSLGISAQFDAYEQHVMRAAGVVLPELTSAEQRTLKLADTCELLLFCLHEMSLGNFGMLPVFTRGMQYVGELRPLYADEEIQLLNFIKEKHYDIFSK